MNVSEVTNTTKSDPKSSSEKKVGFFKKLFGKKRTGVFVDTVVDQDTLNRTSFEIGFESQNRNS